MLSDYVGETRFLKGVSIYLKRRLYGNSVTNDLWEGISSATGMDITQLMDNWVSKIGFPVLTVTETSTEILVRQDRFVETGYADPKDNETIWNVPLSILSLDPNGQAKIDRSLVLKAREIMVPMDTKQTFKLNAGTVGVYRVLYTPDRLTKIALEAAKEDSIFSLNDRMGLLYDAMAFSKAGLAKLSSALSLVSVWCNEKEYLVWSCIASNLAAVASTFWEYPEILDQLNVFRRSLFVPLVDKLGYDYTDADTIDSSLLRTCAVSAAAAAKDPGVIQELKSRFAHLMETGDDSKIPPDLQSVIYSTAVKYGERAEYDAIVRIHDKAKTPTAKLSAIIAMGATQDPELVKETFQHILKKSRDQDIVYSFRGLESNYTTRRMLASFFKENYDIFYKRFEANSTLKYLVEISFQSLSTTADYKDVQEFFKDKDISRYNLALGQTLDTIRARIAYIARSFDDLSEWLLEWEKGRKP